MPDGSNHAASALFTHKPPFTRELQQDQTLCIAYYRVSTDKQGKSGLGLEAQRTAVYDFTQSKGWTITGNYTEVESGKKKSRPKLAEAIKEAKRLKAKLVIAKLDRLARNVHFISGLMESNVDFVAIDMPTADRFMLHVYAAMAEEEGRRISQRTKAALAAAKARGVELGKNGKVLAEKNKQNAQAFAETMRPIIEEIKAEGHTTIRAITAELNRRNIPSREGGRWHIGSVNRVNCSLKYGF
ncbi:MAG: recombinase family protein [Alphaproteobacteria bacterium]|nr:recombinase family protein [Alphaproteobacteria bacterium]